MLVHFGPAPGSALPDPGASEPAPEHWRSIPGLDQLLASAAAPDEFMEVLVAVLRRVPGIDAAWIGRPNQEGLLLPEAVASPEMPVFRDIKAMVNVFGGPTSQGPAGRAWSSGRIQFSSDDEADDRLRPWRGSWQEHGWQFAIAVPLCGIGGVHRILSIYSRNRASLPAWPPETLTEFGLVIGTAIETRVKHAAFERSRRLLETLFAGAEILLNATREQEVLRGICDRLNGTGLFVSAAIGAPDESGEFRYAIAAGPDAPRVRRLRQRLDEEGPQQLLGVRAWKTGTLQLADGYASLASLERWRAIAGPRWNAAAAAPILRGGQTFAILFVITADPTVLDAETLRLIHQLTRIIGRALDEIDIKEALRAERQHQSEIARRCSLTRLPNRLAFNEFLPEALARARRQGTTLGVGILDLDNFKPVNDQHGHAAGDNVLRAVAMRLRATLRETDFVARLGGDEFALVMEDWTPATRADAFCDRLLEAVSQPVLLPDGSAPSVSFSIGLTFFPADAADPDQLVRHADIALYAVKGDKGGRPRPWATYEDCIGRQPVPRYRALLEDHRIAAHFQPVMDTRSGRIASIEALARLAGRGGLIAPKDFLLDFDHRDRKLLFEQVLESGIAALRRVAPLAPELGLSINIDAEVLGLYDIAALLKPALEAAGLPPRRITLELLESHEFRDLALARRRLAALRAAGIRIAIDDLGMEFSNLQRVQQLQVDLIKIDRSFLHDIADQPGDLIFLSTFQTLSDWLGVRMCVEGVETPDMLDAARILGVPLAQGFGIARPMPAEALEEWLAGHAPAPLRGAPKTLLGAFALHTRWLRVLMFDRRSAMPLGYVINDGPLSLASFIRGNGYADTAFGRSYDALIALCTRKSPDMAAVRRLAEEVKEELAAAIAKKAPDRSST